MILNTALPVGGGSSTGAWRDVSDDFDGDFAVTAYSDGHLVVLTSDGNGPGDVYTENTALMPLDGQILFFGNPDDDGAMVYADTEVDRTYVVIYQGSITIFYPV